MEAREKKLWRVVARVARDRRNSNFERRVQSPMATRLPRVCRSALDDLSGTFKIVIGAIIAAAMQRAVVCAV